MPASLAWQLGVAVKAADGQNHAACDANRAALALVQQADRLNAAGALVNLLDRRVHRQRHILAKRQRIQQPGAAPADLQRNRDRRFTNEADSYYDFMRDLIQATPKGQPVQAWLVCDHAFIRRYGLGAFAGLQVNASAQVLGSDGRPIAGLYAGGNDMSSMLDGNYPSGGITLGPAMTFGFIAAHHAAGNELASSSQAKSASSA